ncbi:CPBP family intramembrane metalloprotease [Bradyrhizobium huanghuaihaiense]|uniref:CPBP family intramembrane glutamic endopeptidase n=1 Tax=Bradyrhizobium huanghuaihaiense TaxID=990078 RepID=UPI0021AAB76F|nr:CPBP family intramembrane glutamic endopeptidase [Bradyrhizobium sp. CB3035]UWU80014.1 CPBP family intramembrane metalloprotease [Bradyrhizobium sp. CB3035]
MESRSPHAIGDSKADRVPGIRWFALALVPLVASQLMRLHQNTAAGWLVWDYAGRIAALAILAAIPAARAIAYRTEKRRISFLEIGVWIAGIVLLDRLGQWPQRLIDATFPATVIGKYPHPTGWLDVFDLVFGLALVAASEEIIFRRLLRNALLPYVGDGVFAILVTSLIFGAHHWWTGIGNILLSATIGILFMVMYRRSGALWPVVLVHYLVDLIAFSGVWR